MRGAEYCWNCEEEQADQEKTCPCNGKTAQVEDGVVCAECGKYQEEPCPCHEDYNLYGQVCGECMGITTAFSTNGNH